MGQEKLRVGKPEKLEKVEDIQACQGKNRKWDHMSIKGHKAI